MLPSRPTASPDFEWNDAFLLGHGPMDDEHRSFVDLVALMLVGSDAALPALLERFATLAQRHFETEDAWMTASDFPARACHVEEHAAVMKSVRAIQRRVAAGEIDAARRLAKELRDWFPSHAQHLDSALAHWMCKRVHGGKPVVLRRELMNALR